MLVLDSCDHKTACQQHPEQVDDVTPRATRKKTIFLIADRQCMPHTAGYDNRHWSWTSVTDPTSARL
jgi:hypothetical protein